MIVHPATVHFTVALFALAVVFEWLGWLLKKESLMSAGRWNLSFAALAAIASVLTGRRAAAASPHNEEIHRLIEIHETLGYIILAVIITLFIWRTVAGGKWAAKWLPLYLGLGAVGVAIALTSAYYGGELVYAHGMGVRPVMEEMRAEQHTHSHGGEAPSESPQVAPPTPPDSAAAVHDSSEDAEAHPHDHEHDNHSHN